MTDQELMQMALDALDLVTDLTSYDDEVYEAIDALRARLAQPEPEGKYSDIISDGGLDPRNKFDTALPQREWHGLTDEQIQQIEMSASSKLSAIYLTEAQLKGKNG